MAEDLDREIIAGCLQKQASSQHQLYKKFSGTMYAICLRYLPTTDDANDVLQEAFIKVFDSLVKFRHEGSFEGWIKRLTVNTCLDALKKIKQQPITDDVEFASDLSSSDGLAGSFEAKELMTMLQKLPTGYKTVFNLYAIEGYSHLEIANMLGITESTSKSQLFKARKILQAMLEKLKV